MASADEPAIEQVKFRSWADEGDDGFVPAVAAEPTERDDDGSEDEGTVSSFHSGAEAAADEAGRPPPSLSAAARASLGLTAELYEHLGRANARDVQAAFNLSDDAVAKLRELVDARLSANEFNDSASLVLPVGAGGLGDSAARDWLAANPNYYRRGQLEQRVLQSTLRQAIFLTPEAQTAALAAVGAALMRGLSDVGFTMKLEDFTELAMVPGTAEPIAAMLEAIALEAWVPGEGPVLIEFTDTARSGDSLTIHFQQFGQATGITVVGNPAATMPVAMAIVASGRHHRPGGLVYRYGDVFTVVCTTVRDDLAAVLRLFTAMSYRELADAAQRDEMVVATGQGLMTYGVTLSKTRVQDLAQSGTPGQDHEPVHGDPSKRTLLGSLCGTIGPGGLAFLPVTVLKAIIAENPALGDAPLTPSGLGTGVVRRANGADPRGTTYSVRMVRLAAAAPPEKHVPGLTEEAAKHVLVLCFAANAIGPSWTLDGTLADVLFRTAATTLGELVDVMLGARFIRTQLGYALMSPAEGAQSLAIRLGVQGFRALGQPLTLAQPLRRAPGPYEFRAGAFGLGEPRPWTSPVGKVGQDVSLESLLEGSAVIEARSRSISMTTCQPSIRPAPGSSTIPYIPALRAEPGGPASDVNPKFRAVPPDFARAMTALAPTAPGSLMSQLFPGSRDLVWVATLVNHLLHSDDRAAAMIRHLAGTGINGPSPYAGLWAQMQRMVEEGDEIAWGAPRVVRSGTQSFHGGYVQFFDLREKRPCVAFMTIPALRVPPSALGVLLQLMMAEDGVVPPVAHAVRSNRLVFYIGWGEDMKAAVESYLQHVREHRRHEEKQAAVTRSMDKEGGRRILAKMSDIDAQVAALTQRPAGLTMGGAAF